MLRLQKFGRSLNIVVWNLMLSAFQNDVYVWYGMPEHLDAITTISKDMFYCILASKCPSQK